MKIMSFNIKNDTRFFNNSNIRLKGFIDIIINEKPDIICLQELNYNIKNRLEKILIKNNMNYNFYGDSRFRNNKRLDEYNSILVKSKINVLKTITYSLSNTPLEPLTRFDGDNYPRIITFIELDNYNIYNTHLEHKNHNNKLLQLNCISKIVNNNKPIIITGDFNLDTKYLNDFCKKNNLINTTNDIDYTYNYNNIKKHLDHILVDKNIKYKNIKKYDIHYKRIFISDHYPISIEIE